MKEGQQTGAQPPWSTMQFGQQVRVENVLRSSPVAGNTLLGLLELSKCSQC